MADHSSKATHRPRKVGVAKKRRAPAAKKDEHPVKAGEARIVERIVDPHASDIQMMHRLQDELEGTKAR